MLTVVFPQWISRTVNESGLSSKTPDIVQPDLTSAIRNSTKDQSLGTGGRESQLSAGHLSIKSTPEVIAHCAPDIVVAGLHTALGVSTPLKSDASLGARSSFIAKKTLLHYSVGVHTRAVHSSIFTVHTVVASQWQSRTVNESGLSSCTLDIVQPDLTSATRKSTKDQSSGTSGKESQLSAGHLSIRSTPEVITHCAPDIVVADFHTALSVSASLKSDGSLGARSFITSDLLFLKDAPKEPSDFKEVLLPVDVWRYATTMSGAQCVMTSGVLLMLKWSADSWDSLPLVPQL